MPPLAEVGCADAVADRVDGRGPLGERSGEQSDRHDTHGGDEEEFRGQPPRSGDALGPCQVVRVCFDLGRDQGRAPERTDGSGHTDQHRAEKAEPDVEAGQFASAATRVGVDDVAPAGGERDEDRRRGSQSDECAGAELSPGKPDHQGFSTLRSRCEGDDDDSM